MRRSHHQAQQVAPPSVPHTCQHGATHNVFVGGWVGG